MGTLPAWGVEAVFNDFDLGVERVHCSMAGAWCSRRKMATLNFEGYRWTGVKGLPWFGERRY